MSLTLLYPVRLPPLYFPSVSDRWFGEGRGGVLKGQAHGLLEPADPEPVEAAVVVHADVTTGEVQVVRAAAEPWEST